MIRGLYASASSMASNQVKMDTLSNNLANAESTGFKKDMTVKESFPEMLLHRIEGGSRPTEIGSLHNGVGIDDNYTDFSQGNMINTENPLDMAIDGEAFFVVDTPAGERYTRNGNFVFDDTGQLVTQEGYPVQGEEGPIQGLPGEDIEVDTDGVVYVRDDDNLLEVDALEMVTFADEEAAEKIGDGLWEAEAGNVVEAEDYSVEQGFLEGANVEVVNEMINIIEASRHYEANQRSIQAGDETLQRVVNDVGSLR